MNVNIAYIAGLVDGEAYIGIKRVKPYKNNRLSYSYEARFSIHMASEEPIKLIAETFNIPYHKERKLRSKLSNHLLWYIDVENLQALNIIKTLQPYLRVKQEVANTVVQFGALKEQSQQFKTKLVGYRNFPNKYGTPRKVPTYGLCDEYIELCDGLWEKCKALNY